MNSQDKESELGESSSIDAILDSNGLTLHFLKTTMLLEPIIKCKTGISHALYVSRTRCRISLQEEASM